MVTFFRGKVCIIIYNKWNVIRNFFIHSKVLTASFSIVAEKIIVQIVFKLVFFLIYWYLVT